MSNSDITDVYVSVCRKVNEPFVVVFLCVFLRKRKNFELSSKVGNHLSAFLGQQWIQ